MADSQTPLVTVVIPTHNRAPLLVRAIQSALSQDYPRVEVIVVDDASSDETPQVVGAFPRVRYLRLAENRGGAAARNRGIAAAEGEYIAFLDSDDEWLPAKLTRQVELMLRSSDTAAVYCRHFSHDDTANQRFEQFPPLYSGDIRPMLLAGRCPRTVSLFLVRRTALTAVGGFDEELEGFQDTDLWIRLAEHWLFDAVDEPLAIVHEHSGARITTDPRIRERALDSFIGKWQDEMEKHMGAAGITAFRRRQVAVAQGALVLARVGAGRRREAFAELVRYFQGAGLTNPRQGIGLVLACIGGSRAHRVVKATTNARKALRT